MPPTFLRKLSFSASSKFMPKTVSLRRNSQGNFGFSVRGGLEMNCLPYISLIPDADLLSIKGKLREGAELLEVNGRFVGGERLKSVIDIINMGKSDTIMLTLVDSTSPLSRSKISQLLHSQKSSGKTSEYIEQIRCNIYDSTTPITTRPLQKDEAPGVYTRVTKEDFLKFVADDRMLEWGENPTNGFLYGTLIPREDEEVLRSQQQQSQAAEDSESDEQMSAESLKFNIVVLHRPSFYDAWGLTIAGGAGSDVLPYVSAISPGVKHAAWLTEPLQENASIVAVNGIVVTCASSVHINTILGRHCAAELTLISTADSAPLPYAVLLRLVPASAALAHAQADVRGALFECAVLHTTRPRCADEPAPSPIFVDDSEFAALATANKFLSWVTLDDNSRVGVASPLAVAQFKELPSKLRSLLVQRAGVAAETVLPQCINRQLEFRLHVLPQGKTLLVDAPVGTGLQHGVAIESINGASMLGVDVNHATTLLRQSSEVRVSSKHAFDSLMEAYSRPAVKKDRVPTIFLSRLVLFLFFITLLVLLIAVMLGESAVTAITQHLAVLQFLLSAACVDNIPIKYT